MLIAPDASPETVLARGRAVLHQQGFSRFMGTELTAFGPGHAELQLPLRAEHQQQHGFAHGGVLGYLADLALTFAGGSALDGNVLTSELKINYVRPAVGERLIARAQCVHAGKTQAVTRCEVYAVSGGIEKLCAAAQGTIVRVPDSKVVPKD
ncbi:MAG: PaaI family thioesterase [Desulfovibrionaceae bacterium]|jgi:uncharacterized protein (TIGR00369 family)|nr:PaaI family thioesterase [Desulfovibrionaceae bacterium]